jgi:hypothetical protein
MRLSRPLIVLALAVSLAACGGSSTPTQQPTPTPPAKAIIKVLIDPNPIVAKPSGDPDFPWKFSVNIQLSDSGRVGFVVTAFQTTITAASTGLTWASSYNPFVGVAIPAYGQETRQFRWTTYRMDDNKTKEGTINFKMNFVDDKGNASVYDGTANIRLCGGAIRLLQ